MPRRQAQIHNSSSPSSSLSSSPTKSQPSPFASYMASASVSPSAKDIFDRIKNEEQNLTPYKRVSTKELNVEDEISRRRRLKNDALTQDIKLKKITLVILFIFLGVETIAVFAYAFFQATNLFHFKLEEWSFKLLVSGTLLQITYMLQSAVKHLFPKRE